MKKTAVVLFNLGGPDRLLSVKPFLFNLFNDKAIIGIPNPFRFILAKVISTIRNKKAREIYRQIGGKSPILEYTNIQAEALEKELSFTGDFKVFVCMRYWHPMSAEVVGDIANYNPDEIIMLPLYPHFSTTTTGSSFKDFEKALAKNSIKSEIKKICCYPTNSKFISAHVNLISREIAKVKLDNKGDYRLLFSAHGLPEKVIQSGDPYVFQITKSVESIIEQLSLEIEKIDYRLCFQSKVGPLKWTSPSLEEEINNACNDNKGVIIIPIAFTSDHSETLAELDIEYKEIAIENNIPFYNRVNALNSDGLFIDALVEICKQTRGNKKSCSSDSGKRICNETFSKCPCQSQ